MVGRLHSRTSNMAEASTGSRTSITLEQLHKEWAPVFQKFDHDNDGVIPLTEFRDILLKTSAAHKLPDEVVDEILDRADQDHNGYIDYNEFLGLVRARELGPQKPLFHRMLRTAAFSVVPRSKRTSAVRRYVDEYSCRPPPMFMIMISLVEIGIFVYHAVRLTDKYGYIGANGPVPFESVLIYHPRRRYEAWRYITYMFVHAGIIHIVFNLIVQLILGIPLELVHRWWRVMLVYFSGVAAGSLMTSLVDPTVYLAGASGGVYAIMTAHLASIILNWAEMDFAILRLIGFLILAGTDVAVAIYYRYIGENTNVGYAAHLGGALAGLLVGIQVLRNLEVKPWENKIWWISLILFFLFMVTAIIFNAAYPSYFPESDFSEITEL